MAGAGERTPRTLLEHLLWQQDRTYEELAADFARLADTLGESATISARHLRRLAAGHRAGTTPVTRRVLQTMFAEPVGRLLEPWAPEVESVHGTPAAPVSQGQLIVPSDERNLLTMAAQRARRFALFAGQAGVNAEVIDQLHADVHDLAVAYPQRPVAELLGDLTQVQETIFTLLEQHQRPQHAHQLYFLSSVAGAMLAKASHDLAEPQAAMAQARTAFLCADSIEHDSLRAWLRGLQSLVAYWAGRTQEAVRYAQSGAEFAERAGSTTAVWLPSSEARAWAALGNAEAAKAAIGRAEAAWEQIRQDDLDELGGICTFSRPRQLYYAADTLAWLPGEAEAGERYSIQAVEAYADPSAPEWAFGDQAGSQTDLAIARIGRGELDGAAEAIAPVLSLPVEQRMNGIIISAQRVHRVLAANDQVSQSPAAGALREEIETFVRTPLRLT